MNLPQKQPNPWLTVGKRLGFGLVLGVFLSYFIASFPLGMSVGAVLSVIFGVVAYFESKRAVPRESVFGEVNR